MRIVQLLPTIAYGDAVGNDTLAIYDILENLGIETAIYARGIDQRITGKKIYSFHLLPTLNEDDVLIFHMSISSEFTYAIEKHNCRKIMVYHNITPPDYFKHYSTVYYTATIKGREELRYWADKFDYVLADSEYNKQDLIHCGYTCPIDVLPILIPFKDYATAPDKKVLAAYTGSKVNLLFVGRVAPNKMYQDVVQAFYHYKTKYNANSRLILVGSWKEGDIYKQRLDEYITTLGLTDVIFTGHIKFNAILAYYKLADVFLCMSAHEGFCVPLVEAMLFDVPIVACAAAAIPETLGDAGILLQERDPLLAAGAINKIIKKPGLKQQLIEGQRKQLSKFNYNRVKALFLFYLQKFLQEK